MTERELNMRELNLLLFLETCMVDNLGRLDPTRINADELAKLHIWNDEGFIILKRLPADLIELLKKQYQYNYTYSVDLSDEAWELAHKERRARSVRMADYAMLKGLRV